MANLIVNGDFATGALNPWTAFGPSASRVSVVDGHLEQAVLAYPDNTVDRIGQPVAIPAPGRYRATLRAYASGVSSQVVYVRCTPDGGTPEQGVGLLLGTANQSHFASFDLAAGLHTFEFVTGSLNAYTFILDDVVLDSDANPINTAVATAPSTVQDPITVTVTGLLAGQQYMITRMVEGQEQRMPDQPGANGSGVAVATDFLYPFGVPVFYRVYSSNGQVLWATSNTVATPDTPVPWIHDVVLPETSLTPTVIVNVQSRVRGGRVSVYRLSGQKYPVTIGDVRQASEGDLILFCPDRQARDRTIAVLSSGGPCSLRVPSGCRPVVDDMFFTPLDIREDRFGTNGARTLTVAFVEVEAGELDTFRAVTYDQQTYNAYLNNPLPLTYAGLSGNFAGLTYADLYLSPNGITP
jgi:hypothetical protein